MITREFGINYMKLANGKARDKPHSMQEMLLVRQKLQTCKRRERLNLHQAILIQTNSVCSLNPKVQINSNKSNDD